MSPAPDVDVVEITKAVWPWLEANRALGASLVTLLAAAITLAGGWFVGLKLTARWNLQVKEREGDINAILRVRELYGTLLSIHRSWDDHLKHRASSAWEDRRSGLLDKACDAEGELEGIILKVAGERELLKKEIMQLGFVRQAYQQARECIGGRIPIPWRSSEQSQYQVLKLGTQVLIGILYRERSEPHDVPPDQFARISQNFPFELFKKEQGLAGFIKDEEVFSGWVEP